MVKKLFEEFDLPESNRAMIPVGLSSLSNETIEHLVKNMSKKLLFGWTPPTPKCGVFSVIPPGAFHALLGNDLKLTTKKTPNSYVSGRLEPIPLHPHQEEVKRLLMETKQISALYQSLERGPIVIDSMAEHHSVRIPGEMVSEGVYSPNTLAQLAAHSPNDRSLEPFPETMCYDIHPHKSKSKPSSLLMGLLGRTKDKHHG